MLEEKDIEKIAALARLSLTKGELTQFRNQLSVIMKHFEEIAGIDTQGVLPLVTPTDIEQVLRSDVEEKWSDLHEALKNAPELTGNLFKVPPVV